MTDRDTLIQIYTTEAYQEWFQELADEADMSVSEYGHEVIENHINRETGENQYRRYSTDTSIEVLIEEAQREVTELLTEFESETMEEVKTIQKVRTAYTIAIWRLLQDEYSSEKRRLAMKFAGEHVGRDPPNEPRTPNREADSDSTIAESAGENA